MLTPNIWPILHIHLLLWDPPFSMSKAHKADLFSAKANNESNKNNPRCLYVKKNKAEKFPVHRPTRGTAAALQMITEQLRVPSIVLGTGDTKQNEAQPWFKELTAP